MYTISNKDREDLIEFLSAYREIFNELPDRQNDLREFNRARRASIMIKKLKRKKPNEH